VTGQDDGIHAALAAGDPDLAATRALEAYGPGIFGYLTSLLDEDDARDAFSLFAEDVWKGIGGLREGAALRSWLYRVAWHAAARATRDAWHRRRVALPESAASRIAATIASASRVGAPGSRTEKLARLREQLDPEERTLLVLRVDRGLEWDEVAEVLAEEGSPPNAAALRKRFERLKDKLARLAREQGLVDE
jgi:RNA polymerase sigma-70 factor, ECF subfamily